MAAPRGTNKVQSPPAGGKKGVAKGNMKLPKPDQDGDFDKPPMGYKRGGMVKGKRK